MLSPEALSILENFCKINNQSIYFDKEITYGAVKNDYSIMGFFFPRPEDGITVSDFKMIKTKDFITDVKEFKEYVIEEEIPEKKIAIKGINKWGMKQVTRYQAGNGEEFLLKKKIKGMLDLTDNKYRKITEIYLNGAFFNKLFKKMNRTKADGRLEISGNRMKVYSTVNRYFEADIEIETPLPPGIELHLTTKQLSKIKIEDKKNYILLIKEFNGRVLGQLSLDDEQIDSKVLKYLFMSKPPQK